MIPAASFTARWSIVAMILFICLALGAGWYLASDTTPATDSDRVFVTAGATGVPDRDASSSIPVRAVPMKTPDARTALERRILAAAGAPDETLRDLRSVGDHEQYSCGEIVDRSGAARRVIFFADFDKALREGRDVEFHQMSALCEGGGFSFQ